MVKEGYFQATALLSNSKLKGLFNFIKKKKPLCFRYLLYKQETGMHLCQENEVTGFIWKSEEANGNIKS